MRRGSDTPAPANTKVGDKFMNKIATLFVGIVFACASVQAETQIAVTNIFGTATLNSDYGVNLFQIPKGLVPLSRKLRVVTGNQIKISPVAGAATTNGLIIKASDGLIDDSQMPTIGVDNLYACSTGGIATVDYWIKCAGGSGAPVAVQSLSITPLTASTAFTDSVFTQQLSATGGTAPYYFTIISGAFSNGLSMSSAGLITGTPTVSPLSCGVPTVQAIDAKGVIGSAAINISTPGVTVNAGSFTFSNAVGTNSIIVLTVPNTMAFGTLNTNSWVSLVSGSTGTGSNTLTYAASNNSVSGTVARTGYITVTSSVFKVNHLITQPGNP